MGNKVAPLVFAGALISVADSFSGGWPVRFAPGMDSTGAMVFEAGTVFEGDADSVAGAVFGAGSIFKPPIKFTAGLDSEGGMISGEGAESAGAAWEVESCCSFSSRARRSFSNRRIAARPPVFGLRLLLIIGLTINFKFHFGVGSINQVDGDAVRTREFRHLK